MVIEIVDFPIIIPLKMVDLSIVFCNVYRAGYLTDPEQHLSLGALGCLRPGHGRSSGASVSLDAINLSVARIGHQVTGWAPGMDELELENHMESPLKWWEWWDQKISEICFVIGVAFCGASKNGHGSIFHQEPIRTRDLAKLQSYFHKYISYPCRESSWDVHTSWVYIDIYLGKWNHISLIWIKAIKGDAFPY